MRNTKVFLASMVAIVALAACSSNSGAPTPNPTSANPSPVAATEPTPAAANPSPAEAPTGEVSVPDACKLLTKDLAASIIGTIAIGPKLVGPKDGMSSCTYIGEGYTTVLSLVIKGGISDSDFEAAFQASKGVSGVDATKVDGLGDAAYWAGGSLGQLNIHKGGNWIILDATGAKGDLQSTLKDAATKIVASM
jgi:hypothetical protein